MDYSYSFIIHINIFVPINRTPITWTTRCCPCMARGIPRTEPLQGSRAAVAVVPLIAPPPLCLQVAGSLIRQETKIRKTSWLTCVRRSQPALQSMCVLHYLSISYDLNCYKLYVTADKEAQMFNMASFSKICELMCNKRNSVIKEGHDNTGKCRKEYFVRIWFHCYMAYACALDVSEITEKHWFVRAGAWKEAKEKQEERKKKNPERKRK